MKENEIPNIKTIVDYKNTVVLGNKEYIIIKNNMILCETIKRITIRPADNGHVAIITFDDNEERTIAL